jgi:ComF family protein
VAAVDYASPWDQLIGRFKFHAALDLGDALADQMMAALARAGQPDPGLLLPAPLSAERLRERGYNQAWELTRRLARRLNASADATLLLRVRHAPAQMGLPLSDRAANVQHAFAVEPRRRGELQGRTVTIVDDVMTTGATVGEISRVLRAAGAARVQVWALARTPAPGD